MRSTLLGKADRNVIDGPLAETKELIAGFWLGKCASLQEAIEWAKHCPIGWKANRRSRSRCSAMPSTSAKLSRRNCARRSTRKRNHRQRRNEDLGG